MMVRLAGLGADFTARHRSVDIFAAQIIDLLGKNLGVDRRDRAHIDHGLARGQSLGNTVLAKQNRSDMGRVKAP